MVIGIFLLSLQFHTFFSWYFFCYWFHKSWDPCKMFFFVEAFPKFYFWNSFWGTYFGVLNELLFSRLRNTSNRRNTKGQGLQLIPRPFGGPHHWLKELLWKQSRNIKKQPKTTIDFRNFATMTWGKVLAHMICSIYLVFWQKKHTLI